MRNSGHIILQQVSCLARSVLLERFQRGRGGLFERLGILLDGSERFTEFLAKARSAVVERFEDLLLAFCFDLLAGQRVAGLRVDSSERDYIMRAKIRDGNGQHGFDAYALADF